MQSGGRRPSIMAIRFVAALTAMPFLESNVALAVCGVMTTLGKSARPSAAFGSFSLHET